MTSELRQRLGPKSVAAMLRCLQRFGGRTVWQLYRGRGLRKLSMFDDPIYVRATHVDRELFASIFLEEQYGSAEVKSRNARFIIDAGANIGLASVYFARLFPQAKIVALEPSEENYQLLRRNVAPYPNVICLQAALWHEPGVVKIANPAAEAWAFQCQAATDGVPALTVPLLMQRYGAASIDILKVDIEGAEREVFAQSCDWLERVRVLCVELHDRFAPGSAEAVYSAITTRHFQKSQCGDVIAFQA